jgi:MFS family permease
VRHTGAVWRRRSTDAIGTPVMRRGARGPLALTAGLVFADATIVTLALPDLLVDLDTTVYGVAAVLAVYTLALGAAAIPAARLVRRRGGHQVALVGLCLFSLASLACAAAGGIALLLAARAVQGASGALVLAVAGSALTSGLRGTRLWTSIAVLSAALGPAVGGALTQAFSWRAIFIAQAPVPLVAAALLRRSDENVEVAETDEAQKPALRPVLALGLVSGALTALLFGVVLLLVVGWAMQPLSAALAVTVVPLSAFAGARIRRGRPETRVVVGASLIGGGIGALAFLPSNNVGWLLVPECVAGVGMGLALAPLLEQLLPETTARRRAGNLAIRHLGVTAALLVLAPVIAHDLDAAVERAKLRTVAVVLDAPVQPSEKIRIAPKLVETVHADQPLAAVRQDARSVRRDVDASQRPLFDELFDRVEDVFVRAASEAFRDAFLIASALAFAAALVLFSRASRDAALAALVAGLAIVGVQALVHHFESPRTVAIADPCAPRTTPESEGLQGVAQTLALKTLDFASCRLGSSREELLLALTDDSEADHFERRHGVNPRSLRALLRLIG